MSRESSAKKTTYISLVSNLLLAIIKWIVGFVGNSFALIADAIESTTDVFSSILVLLGIEYSSRPADENHPYGHGRVEVLVTFMVVAFLVISATIIAYQSILNIQTPHLPPKGYTLYVLGAIIVWKELSYQWVKRKSKEIKSTVLEAEAWHHRSDAITSAAAFIGISVAVIMGDEYAVADDWAALLASGFILYNAYMIFRPALGEMMDENLHEDLIEEIRIVSQKVNGVLDTEKCFIRKAGMRYHVELHAIVSSEITVKEGHDISHVLMDTLKSEFDYLGRVSIHIEPDDYHV
jgi:cation diffusion facilitator family transporter